MCAVPRHPSSSQPRSPPSSPSRSLPDPQHRRDPFQRVGCNPGGAYSSSSPLPRAKFRTSWRRRSPGYASVKGFGGLSPPDRGAARGQTERVYLRSIEAADLRAGFCRPLSTCCRPSSSSDPLVPAATSARRSPVDRRQSSARTSTSSCSLAAAHVVMLLGQIPRAVSAAGRIHEVLANRRLGHPPTSRPGPVPPDPATQYRKVSNLL